LIVYLQSRSEVFPQNEVTRYWADAHKGRSGVVYLVDNEDPSAQQSAMVEICAELAHALTQPLPSLQPIRARLLTVEKSSHCVLTTSVPTFSAIYQYTISPTASSGLESLLTPPMDS
jgi:hypothetical protein